MPLPIPQQFRALFTRRSEHGWLGLLAGSIALSMVLLALAWGLTWQRLEAERQLVDRNARRQQENLASIVSENLSQVLDRGRLISISSAEWVSGNSSEAGKRLMSMRAVDRAFLRIELYDKALRRIYGSSPGHDSRRLLKTMASALDNPELRLTIGPPTDAYEANWQVPLLFPIAGNDGNNLGILLATLDMGYFLGLYQNIDIGQSGVIQILDATGSALAEARPAGLVLHPLPSRLGQRLIDGGSQASLTGEAFDDGKTYLSSYRKLDRYPLTVMVSRELGEIRAEHADLRSRYFTILLGLTSLILLATLWIARSIRRQQQLLSELQAANKDKRELIDQLEVEKLHALDLAAYDHLTGLHNRRMFHELASSHLSRTKRNHRHDALLYLDLDRFKGINDTLGHHVGDLLLQKVAERLRSTLRESDLIARLGGDEYAVMLTGVDSTGHAAMIAAKLVDEISQPCLAVDGHDIQVTPSIGIAIFPRDGHDIDTLCRHADAAMYRAKQAGRGRYTFFDPALNQVADRLFNLEQRLPKAIADNELLLHFQPKVRLSDYRITGFEALVRWQHPEFGLIYPNDFIPLAESSGLIVDLGAWVAENCCRQVAQWRSTGLASVPIAFNISARQLQDDSLAASIAAQIEAHGIAGRDLEIDITESSLLGSLEGASRSLGALEGLGLRIALDDFGNGFANLNYIRSLPIHCVKIDRSFVGDIRNRPDDAVIVDSIITLAHNLRMQVVAEGVELRDQMIHLKAAGCDEVQGYYLSRPVPADAARLLLLRSIIAPT